MPKRGPGLCEECGKYVCDCLPDDGDEEDEGPSDDPWKKEKKARRAL